MTFEIISKQIVSQEQMIHCKLHADTKTHSHMCAYTRVRVIDVYGKVVRHAKGERRTHKTRIPRKIQMFANVKLRSQMSFIVLILLVMAMRTMSSTALVDKIDPVLCVGDDWPCSQFHLFSASSSSFVRQTTINWNSLFARSVSTYMYLQTVATASVLKTTAYAIQSYKQNNYNYCDSCAHAFISRHTTQRRPRERMSAIYNQHQHQQQYMCPHIRSSVRANCKWCNARYTKSIKYVVANGVITICQRARTRARTLYLVKFDTHRHKG